MSRMFFQKRDLNFSEGVGVTNVLNKFLLVHFSFPLISLDAKSGGNGKIKNKGEGANIVMGREK